MTLVIPAILHVHIAVFMGFGATNMACASTALFAALATLMQKLRQIAYDRRRFYAADCWDGGGPNLRLLRMDFGRCDEVVSPCTPTTPTPVTPSAYGVFTFAPSPLTAMILALPDDGVHVSDSDEVHTSVGDESLPDFTDGDLSAGNDNVYLPDNVSDGGISVGNENIDLDV
jgi:hypothetical protein